MKSYLGGKGSNNLSISQFVFANATMFAFKSLTPVSPHILRSRGLSERKGAIRKSDFLKRKHLIFSTIFVVY